MNKLPLRFWEGNRLINSVFNKEKGLEVQRDAQQRAQAMGNLTVRTIRYVNRDNGWADCCPLAINLG